MPNASVVNSSQTTRAELADHGYAAPSPQAARRPHASLPAGATLSTWVPPAVLGMVGTPAKRRRVDSTTSQLAASDVASGDSFQTTIYALYYAPPDSRLLGSAVGPLDLIKV